MSAGHFDFRRTPPGGLCGEPNAISNAINYAKFFSCSHDAVIHVYDEGGNVIETHEHTGDFRSVGRHAADPSKGADARRVSPCPVATQRRRASTQRGGHTNNPAAASLPKFRLSILLPNKCR
jgi:hypothetical protein